MVRAFARRPQIWRQHSACTQYTVLAGWRIQRILKQSSFSRIIFFHSLRFNSAAKPFPLDSHGRSPPLTSPTMSHRGNIISKTSAKQLPAPVLYLTGSSSEKVLIDPSSNNRKTRCLQCLLQLDMPHKLTAVCQLTVHVACEIILIIAYRVCKLMCLKYCCFSGYSVHVPSLDISSQSHVP